MRRRQQSLKQQLSANFEKKYALDNGIIDSLQSLEDEADRVANVMSSVPQVIDNLNKEFIEATKLQNKDINLLFIATGMQCLRQYLMSNDSYRLTSTQGDKLAETIVPKKWHNILLESVPYDAIRLSDQTLATKLSGYTHRYRTLGHDPIFGWIFGPLNIITDSLTKVDFVSTYEVSGMTICGNYSGGTVGAFKDCIQYVSADKMLLPVSVMRQALHFGSDYFTKQGLPIPLLPSFNNDFAKFLVTKCNIDMYSVTRGAAIAALINSIIHYIHTILFNIDEDNDIDLYSVRTRKILSYSNIISSTSNIINVAVRTYFGDVSALKKIDVGGFLVTIYRIVTDKKYINMLKQEFLENKLYNIVVDSK